MDARSSYCFRVTGVTLSAFDVDDDFQMLNEYREKIENANSLLFLDVIFHVDEEEVYRANEGQLRYMRLWFSELQKIVDIQDRLYSIHASLRNQSFIEIFMGFLCNLQRKCSLYEIAITEEDYPSLISAEALSNFLGIPQIVHRSSPKLLSGCLDHLTSIGRMRLISTFASEKMVFPCNITDIHLDLWSAEADFFLIYNLFKTVRKTVRYMSLMVYRTNESIDLTKFSSLSKITMKSLQWLILCTDSPILRRFLCMLEFKKLVSLYISTNTGRYWDDGPSTSFPNELAPTLGPCLLPPTLKRFHVKNADVLYTNIQLSAPLNYFLLGVRFPTNFVYTHELSWFLSAIRTEFLELKVTGYGVLSFYSRSLNLADVQKFRITFIDFSETLPTFPGPTLTAPRITHLNIDNKCMEESLHLLSSVHIWRCCGDASSPSELDQFEIL